MTKTVDELTGEPVTALHSRAWEIVAKGKFEAAVRLMDDDVREEIHRMGSLSRYEFLVEYARRDPSFAPLSGAAW